MFVDLVRVADLTKLSPQLHQKQDELFKTNVIFPLVIKTSQLDYSHHIFLILELSKHQSKTTKILLRKKLLKVAKDNIVVCMEALRWWTFFACGIIVVTDLKLTNTRILANQSQFSLPYLFIFSLSWTAEHMCNGFTYSFINERHKQKLICLRNKWMEITFKTGISAKDEFFPNITLNDLANLVDLPPVLYERL